MRKPKGMQPIYSDAALLVIDKPAGLPVLPDGWEPDAPYLVRLLEPEYGRAVTGSSSAADGEGLWVVHRLDKVTSGVIVFARTAEAHRALSIQFEKHTAEKIYHAVCAGLPAWETHTARHRLRVNVGHSHRTVVDNGRGTPAETHFRVLRRFSKYALLECIPATGKTHQIRVHAYALGYPLLGDPLYSGPKTELIARPALHAFSLALTHPTTGERVTFEAPYPPDFAAVVR